MPDVKPKYRVKPVPLEQNSTKIIATVNDKNKKGETGGVISYREEQRKGPHYDVFLPGKRSLRVDEKELKRLGFDKQPDLVDMETGETISVNALEETM